MKSLVNFVSIFMLLIKLVSSSETGEVEISCGKISTFHWPYVGNLNTCQTGRDTKVLRPSSFVNNKSKDISIEAIWFHFSSQVRFVPKKLKENFPDLKMLFFSYHLETLSEFDLQQFGCDLEYLHVDFCKISYLPKNLFKHNPYMKYIHFEGNPLKTIEIGFFANISKMKYLEQIVLIQCSCIYDHKTKPRIQNDNKWTHNCTELETRENNLMNSKEEKLECFMTDKFNCETSDDLVCKASGLKIRNLNTKIVRIDRGTAESNEKIKSFVVNDQHIEFLPLELAEIFPNLKEVFVINSQLKMLTSNDFNNLENLKTIIITNNKISSIEENIFNNLSSLEILDLSANGISHFPPNIFARLIRMKTLNLSDNQLGHFYSSSLPPVNKIEVFSISNNVITNFDKKVLRYLRKVKKIDLTRNICIDEKFDRSYENATEAFTHMTKTVQLICNNNDED